MILKFFIFNKKNIDKIIFSDVEIFIDKIIFIFFKKKIDTWYKQ